MLRLVLQLASLLRGTLTLSDGRRTISGSFDKTIRIWDTNTGAVVGQPLQGHTEGSGHLPSHGRCIISTIRIWDAETGAAIGKSFNKGVNSVAYSPDGQHIISGCDDRITAQK